MAQITYENKVKINDSSLPAINKVRDVDMNEIKSVVNENDDNVGDLSLLNTINKSSIVGAINEIVDRNVFSTVEKIIGKWIDGKPIYRKVCVINSPVVGTISYAHYISNFKTLISATANGTQANGGQQYFPRAVPGDSNWSLNIGDVNSTTFSLQIANNNTGNYAFTKVNVILEYTKTTD